jgi:4-amino-4-deoxy-L-arabinose transferase-like glycosyltransferase
VNSFFRLILRRGSTARLFWGGCLLLIIVLTRWLWIDCDGGVPSLNEYGYFVTDEGFYTGGAKEKLLSGHFVDIPRGETCTYTICQALHLLTYGSFLLFGQTSWAHRLLPFAINTLAWLLMFWHLSRRTLPWIGFVLCAGILMTPFVMMYERTACNDVLMASVLMIGFCLTQKKGLFFTALGGCVFGLGFLVKMSIVVLFSLGVSAALMKRAQGRRWLHVLVCVGAFLLVAGIQQQAIRWSVAHEAATQNVTVTHLLNISNAHYALPSPFDWQNTFKGFSSFPRMPTDTRLGVFVVLIFLFPSLLFLRRFSRSPFRWDGKMLFYLSFPLYTCGILIMGVYYAHYLLPLIVLLPALWLEARKDLRGLPDRYMWANLCLFVLAGVLLVWAANLSVVARKDLPLLSQFISQAYNMPQKILWLHNGKHILITALLLAGCLLLVRFRRPQVLPTLCMLASALLAANLCFNLLPLVQAVPYAPPFKPSQAVAILFQVASVVLLFCVWHPPRMLLSGKRFILLYVAFLAFGFLQNPAWRGGLAELQQKKQLQKQAVKELKQILPANAVVTGERSSQLLLTLPARAMPTSGDSIPMLQALHKSDPSTAFYCIVDPEHAYVWQYYKKNPDKISMELIHKMRLPSFGSGMPIDVFLARLVLKQEGPLAKP